MSLASAVRISRRPSPYCTSHRIDEVDVELEGGNRLELVAKDVSVDGLSEEARRSRPAFQGDPLREIAVYREVLSPEGLDAPAFYGVLAGSWLLVERVRGVELWQVGDLAVWQEVARRTAAMHARMAPKAEEVAGRARLLRYEEGFFRLWAHRARAFVAEVTPVVERYEPVVERLAALPRTFVHGELYPSNVLVDQRGSSVRVAPVDWETAGLGPGLLDLAALSAGWAEGERRALARAYREALEAEDEEVLLADLDRCRLHLALRSLGWSRDWSPPAEHARDWLAEALDLAERLDL